MNRDLTAYSLSGFHCEKWYEENKSYYLNPESNYYGQVLVRMKRVKVGFSIKVKLFYRNQWYWKPHFSWKFSKYFHWLFFMLWVDSEYDDVPDVIVSDHLKESGGMVTDDGREATNSGSCFIAGKARCRCGLYKNDCDKWTDCDYKNKTTEES